MLQNATPLRKSAPGPPNSSDEHVSCTAPATENASLQILFQCPTPAIVFGHAAKPSLLTRCTIPCACHAKRHLNVKKCSGAEVFCTFWLGNLLRATTASTFSTSQLLKVLRSWSVLYILTSKCASRHNGVHFFGSEADVFCTFWLGNLLRARTACTFSTSQLRKVLRTWGVLYILAWKCASRHNGVQFFISHLASWLRTRCLSEPTFRPSGATNHWKNTVFRDFPTFLRAWIFFLLRLSLFELLSFSLLFSDSSHLCFSSVHIVGSLTSKLPSISYWWVSSILWA